MADSLWFMDLGDKVYTILKTLMTSYVGSTYSLNFGAEGHSNTDAEFPYVYFIELPFDERGNDLKNDEIHGVLENIEIQVSVNTNRDDCRAIVGYATYAMKKMRFNVVSNANYIQTGNVYRGVIRFRRTIGASDSLL